MDVLSDDHCAHFRVAAVAGGLVHGKRKDADMPRQPSAPLLVRFGGDSNFFLIEEQIEEIDFYKWVFLGVGFGEGVG